MKYILFLGLIGTYVTPILAQTIEQSFPLKWSTEIGNVSYRTLPALAGGKLFVGSNGEHFNDYYHESGNAVHVLNPSTGAHLGVIGDDAWGDLDVNGVVAYNGRVYFGNDNDEFLCYDAQTLALEWRLPTSGDVEHAPIVVRRSSGNVVVYATEQGEVRAVNPSNGNTVWVHYAQTFDGWKPGKTRFVYRVAAAMSRGYCYFAAPVVKDIDGDGVADLNYTSDQGCTGISGQTGRVLYNLPVRRNAHCQPLILDHEQGPVLAYVSYDWENQTSTIHRVLLPSGKELPFTRTQGYIDLPYSLPPGNGSAFKCNQEKALIRISADEPAYRVVHSVDLNYVRSSTFTSLETLNWKGTEAVLEIVEYDYNTERSMLRVRDAKSWKLLDSFVLPTRTESTPHLIDVDRDGAKELLFGCADGRLYCHEIPNQ